MRTLLQEKNRPIHILRPTKTYVAYTWCGVDPCRRGVRTEGVNSGVLKATCKTCLKLARQAPATRKLLS